MGIKNNWVWDLRSEDEKMADERKERSAKSTPIVAQAAPTGYITPDTPLASIQPKFIKYFQDKMEAANKEKFPGPDYYEYSKLMKRLSEKSPNLSETDMINAVLNTTFIDVDPKIIIESADRYIKEIFEPDRVEMMAEAERKKSETVGVKQQQIKDLTAKKLSTEEEIKRLQASLSGYDTEIAKLSDEVGTQT